MRSSILLLVATAALSTAHVSRAQDWPRYHVSVGIGLGNADFGTDWESAGVPEFIRPTKPLDTSGTRWRVSAGLRPLRLVGAEIEYIALGEGKAEDGYSPNMSVSLGDYRMKTKASAFVLSAVLFIPDRSPKFDAYGKLGVARHEESFDVHVSNWTPMCRLQPFGQAPECLFDNQGDRTSSQPYLGIGARFRLATNWAARVEYESIDGDFGDNTTMFSLSLAWER